MCWYECWRESVCGVCGVWCAWCACACACAWVWACAWCACAWCGKSAVVGLEPGLIECSECSELVCSAESAGKCAVGGAAFCGEVT